MNGQNPYQRGVPGATPPVAPGAALPTQPTTPTTPTAGMDVNFDQFSPEELQALLELGAVPEQVKEAARREQQARQTFGQAAPEGRQAGNIYMAANPMEHLGRGIQQYAALRDRDAMRDRIDALRQQQVAGRQSFLNQMYPGGNPAAAPSAGAAAPAGPPQMPVRPPVGAGGGAGGPAAQTAPYTPPNVQQGNPILNALRR